MSLWQMAIEDALRKIKVNIGKFGDQFPHVSKDGGNAYTLTPNADWTEGFWSGMLWLSYEYSGDDAYRKAALRTVNSFQERLRSSIVLDHHDIGFLYSLSAKACWIIVRDEEARQLALRAADKLMLRYREKGGYIQAWGQEGHETNGGRIIIDCLMNLPLLYWAYEQTGNIDYLNVAVTQADKSRRYLVRGDDSSYHTFHFNQESGEPIGGSTAQGYTNGSTWTRGQAWGIYGFALSYRYTGNRYYLDTSRRMARYFLDHLPEDSVAYWDFNVPIEADTYRDSSASAITCAGLLELMSHLEEDDADRKYFEQGLICSMESLVRNYSTIGDERAEGLIKHGSYHVRGNSSPDDFMSWGDYFYLEALLRMEKGIQSYWVDRK